MNDSKIKASISASIIEISQVKEGSHVDGLDEDSILDQEFDVNNEEVFPEVYRCFEDSEEGRKAKCIEIHETPP